MSKGLGKVERAILERLGKNDRETVRDLARCVFHPDYYKDEHWCFHDPVTHSEVASVSRAANKLASKELVRIERRCGKTPFGYIDTRLRWVERISVDGSHNSQHLPEATNVNQV